MEGRAINDAWWAPTDAQDVCVLERAGQVVVNLVEAEREWLGDPAAVGDCPGGAASKPASRSATRAPGSGARHAGGGRKIECPARTARLAARAPP
jgi:hypothetical protein